jgi:hypothetical protein
MIDQPSQAYFPDVWPEDTVNAETTKYAESADIEGVKRIFRTLELAIKRTNGALQIIVTDHAGEITWKDVEHINVIGNWRNGKDDFLIPKDWLEIDPPSEDGPSQEQNAL